MATEEFKVGPEHLNDVLAEAEVDDIRFTKTDTGALWLDTKLTGRETIDRLVNGMATLYVKLRAERRSSRG